MDKIETLPSAGLSAWLCFGFCFFVSKVSSHTDICLRRNPIVCRSDFVSLGDVTHGFQFHDDYLLRDRFGHDFSCDLPVQCTVIGFCRSAFIFTREGRRPGTMNASFRL